MKTKTEVNKEALVAAVNAVEANGALANRSVLFDAVAVEYNKTAPKSISAAVVSLRLVEFAIEPKTPKGKKGRPKGSKNHKVNVVETVAVDAPVTTETAVDAPVTVAEDPVVTTEDPAVSPVVAGEAA